MRTEAANCLKIRAHGLQRSGNHAILHWIACQSSGIVLHLNDCTPGTNPFRTMEEYVHYEDGRILERINLWAEGSHFDPATAPRKRDIVIHSYEDCALTPRDRECDRPLGRAEKLIDLLIIRDPLNFFASRFAIWSKLTGIKDRRALVDLWKSYAAEAICPSVLPPDSTVVANFSLWAESPAYRRSLAESLGLEFNDRGFDEIPPIGPGSSFDGFRYSSRASKMRVNERWKKFRRDATFLSVVCDPEIVGLAQSLFSSMREWQNALAVL